MEDDLTKRTTTVYYWPTEIPESAITDIHYHEQDGWRVEQIVPMPNVNAAGNVPISEGGMYVVYAKDTTKERNGV